MGVRRLIVAMALTAAAFGGCGGDSTGAKQADFLDQHMAARQQSIKKAVKDGVLPPVALQMLRSNGEINISFIDGPKGDKDVVHTNGSTGPKLKWDLDQDGKIERSERTITERELYDATLGLR
jgi:hypothetical protein